MNRTKTVIIIILASLIAYQTYEIYQIEKRIDEATKSGQMKCQKP